VIQTLLRVPVVTIVLLGIAWAACLLQDEDPAHLISRERDRLRSAFGEGAPVPTIAASTMGSPFPLLDRFPPRVSGSLRAGIEVSRMRIAILLRLLPVAAVFLLAGGLAGAVFRERIRHARGYASPTAAFVARGLVCGGLLLAILFGLTSVALPYWLPYVAIMGTCVGWCLYVSNLPIKL
jgi:hypothetical protein